MTPTSLPGATASPDPSAAGDPAACPACGGTVVNGQGLYSCFDCEWALGPAESAFDHPALQF